MFCSIVIPTFNRAHTLRRTLASVVRQDLTEFECLVVDDGGTDDTAQLVESFDDPRIRYFWKPNEERGAARNYGTVHATGRYVYFLDSDDLLTPDHLSHGQSCLGRLGWPEVLHSRFSTVTEHGELLHIQRYPQPLSEHLRRRNMVGSYLFVRRDVALAHPFVPDREFSIAEDWYVVLALLRRYRIHLSDRITRNVVTHPGQSMAWKPEKFARSRELLLHYLTTNGVIAADDLRGLRTIDAEMESLVALQAALGGNRSEAARRLLRALRLRPTLLLDRRTLGTAKHLVLGTRRVVRES